MTVDRLSRVRLGHSDVTVPALSLGTAPLGNLYSTVLDTTAYETIIRGLRHGLNYVDTAPHYGLGVAERRLGEVLTGLRRDSFVLSTKVGRLLRRPEPGESVDLEGFVGVPPYQRVWDFSRDGIRRSLEESLLRLGVDGADIVYLHDPDEHGREAFGTGFAALAELRDEGVVGAIGVGMNQAAMLTRFVRETDIDVVLCAGRYTLLDHTAAGELLPACNQRGVSMVVGGVYNSGLLANPVPGAPFDYAEAPVELVARSQHLAEVCARHDVPLRAAALQFPLAHPSVASVCVGVRCPEEVDDNVAMAAVDIPDALWKEFRARELVPAGIPLPGDT